MALVEDLCASLATIGFRRIVFLNGHYDNTYAIAYACANAADRLPAGVRAFPINYWDGMTADEAAEFFGPRHGPARQPGRDLGRDGDQPRPRRPGARERRDAAVPRGHQRRRRPYRVLLLGARSVHRATHSGTWGDARESTAEFGERYLAVVTAATVRMLDDIERTFAAMPDR